MKKHHLTFALLAFVAPFALPSLLQSQTTAPAAAPAAPAAPATTTGSYVIDPTHTAVTFSIGHLGVSKTAGRFNDISGTIEWNEESPEKSVIDVSVKVASVDTNNAERDKHLNSADFFNSENFTALTFKSTSVKKVEGKTYEITGDLTVLGVTKPLTVKADFLGSATDPWGGFRIGGSSSFDIKRSDFGMSNMINLIADDVAVNVDIEAIKQ